MDIVDAQVHANMLGTESTLAIMDALGIAGVLFDEFEKFSDGVLLPGYRVGDAFRAVGPNAEAAAIQHPERFTFLMRVDPTDPGIESWVETLTAAPGFKALRTTVFNAAEGAVFEEGGHDRLLKTARAHQLPVFVSFLSTAAYPFPDLEPKLRRALDAFGPQRVMWASDYTMTRHRASWAETLFSIRDSAALSADEKTWVLGRTARHILKWPAAQ